MSERTIMHKIQIALAGFGAKLFRNQVGLYELKDGRKLKSGLGPGSSDLIGWHSVQITPKMVGRRVAVFTAVEIKTPKGKISDTQQNYIDQVKLSGGVAYVATSREEAVEKLFKESPLANGTGY